MPLPRPSQSPAAEVRRSSSWLRFVAEVRRRGIARPSQPGCPGLPARAVRTELSGASKHPLGDHPPDRNRRGRSRRRCVTDVDLPLRALELEVFDERSVAAHEVTNADAAGMIPIKLSVDGRACGDAPATPEPSMRRERLQCVSWGNESTDGASTVLGSIEETGFSASQSKAT